MVHSCRLAPPEEQGEFETVRGRGGGGGGPKPETSWPIWEVSGISENMYFSSKHALHWALGQRGTVSAGLQSKVPITNCSLVWQDWRRHVAGT